MTTLFEKRSLSPWVAYAAGCTLLNVLRLSPFVLAAFLHAFFPLCKRDASLAFCVLVEDQKAC